MIVKGFVIFEKTLLSRKESHNLVWSCAISNIFYCAPHEKVLKKCLLWTDLKEMTWSRNSTLRCYGYFFLPIYLSTYLVPPSSHLTSVARNGSISSYSFSFVETWYNYPQREMGRQKVFPITPIKLLVIVKYGSLWSKWIYFGWYNSAELLEINFQRFLLKQNFLISCYLCSKINVLLFISTQ